MSDIAEDKKAAAKQAISFVLDDMVVGLGTGSTAFFAIKILGEKVAAGLQIKGVPTSLVTAHLAHECGIPLLAEFDKIDLTIDGADEVDPQGNLIKGGGGALTREKIVAAASEKEIIIVHCSKQVKRLGQFPLPVEVLPFGLKYVVSQLRKDFACEVRIRKSGDEAFRTDNGNYIVDCEFNQIVDPAELTVHLNNIPGVVDNGLFVGLTDLVIVGKGAGEAETILFDRKKSDARENPHHPL